MSQSSKFKLTRVYYTTDDMTNKARLTLSPKSQGQRHTSCCVLHASLSCAQSLSSENTHSIFLGSNRKELNDTGYVIKEQNI